MQLSHRQAASGSRSQHSETPLPQGVCCGPWDGEAGAPLPCPEEAGLSSSASSPLRAASPRLPELTSQLPAATKRGGVTHCPSLWLLCPVLCPQTGTQPCAASGTSQLASSAITNKFFFRLAFLFPLDLFSLTEDPPRHPDVVGLTVPPKLCPASARGDGDRSGG